MNEERIAGSPISRRREVVISGRRVRVVDMHAHCSVPEAMALMPNRGQAGGGGPGGGAGNPSLPLGSYQERLAAMNAQGIDVEALSINPYWYRAERDAAEEVIRVQNERLAEFCGKESERFV